MTGLGVAAAATLLFAAAPAYAQPQALTWTVATPAFCAVNTPCNISASDAGPLVFTNKPTTTTITCAGGTLTGFLTPGNGGGLPLGDILGPAATPFTGCLGGGFAFGTTATYNWLFNGTSYAAGVTTGQVTEMSIQFASGGVDPCTFTISGAASFTYANATGLLRFNPNVGLMDQLAFSNVSAGCGTTFQNSPANEFSGSYTLIWTAAGTNPQITAS